MNAARFRLSASPALAALLVLVHGAAAGAVLSALPGSMGIALSLAMLALGLAAAWSRALHLSAVSVRAIHVEGTQATLEMRGGARLPVQLARRRYVSSLLVTLSVVRPGRRTLVVTRDMLDPESFRALRLWALWEKLPAARERVRVASGQLSA